MDGITRRFGIFIIIIFVLGMAMGFSVKELWREEEKKLPKDLNEQMKRLRLINRSVNVTLKDYKIVGAIAGTYEASGPVFETFTLAFEDRPGGASADLDYFDLLIEIKRNVNESKFVIRAVQLGLDTIDIYLDDNYIGSLRPSIEIEVKF